jgi:hypothetical protein
MDQQDMPGTVIIAIGFAPAEILVGIFELVLDAIDLVTQLVNTVQQFRRIRTKNLILCLVQIRNVSDSCCIFRAYLSPNIARLAPHNDPLLSLSERTIPVCATF